MPLNTRLVYFAFSDNLSLFASSTYFTSVTETVNVAVTSW